MSAIVSRRAVLEAAMATPFASLVAAPFLASHAESAVLPLERFVYDSRFAEAFDVAQLAARLGVPLSAVADDLMDLWYDELDLLWRDRPMALAGVTMTEALFVLETLAADRRMRVVYRGEHGLVENGRISHKLVGPAELVERVAAAGNVAWKGELARAMTRCPLGAPTTAEVEFVTSAPELSLRDVPLVSWIIAPRSAVAVSVPS